MIEHTQQIYLPQLWTIKPVLQRTIFVWGWGGGFTSLFVFGFSLIEWYLETKIWVPSMLIVIGVSLLLSP